MGHSFGGAVSALVLSEDPRVVAAVNIDGTPYGDLPDRRLTRPYLLVQSDLGGESHGPLFLEGNGKLLARMTAPGLRYELTRADHFSFTDAPFFLAAPVRWALAQLTGATRGPAATQQATADLLAAFLSGPLTGVEADLAAVAARYPGVLGGRVPP
jgi:pimeloyl-ACP methyl ester carboxylesterase